MTDEEAEDAAVDKPPPFLDDGESYCDPQNCGNRYFFAPSTHMPRWPVYATLFAPYLGLYFSPTHSPHIILLALTIMVMAEAVAIYLLRPVLRSKSFVAWLSQASIPPGANFGSVSDCCEFHHTNPEHHMGRDWTCLFIWYLQCLAAVLQPRESVITGVAYHHQRVVPASTRVDRRLPNMQGIKPTNTKVTYDLWTVASFSTGISSVMVSCEAVARQFIPRLRCLTPAERELQAENMSTRVANVIVHAANAPEVFRGSARIAIAHCSSSDVANSVVKDARFYAPLALDVLVALLSTIPFFLLIDDVSTTGSVFADYGHYVVPLLLSPILEELVKTVAGRTFGVGRLVASPIFGLIELYWSYRFANNVEQLFPAFIMHAIVGFLSTPTAMVVHFAFNACVLACRLMAVVDPISQLDPVQRGMLKIMCDMQVNPTRSKLADSLAREAHWFDPKLHCGTQYHARPDAWDNAEWLTSLTAAGTASSMGTVLFLAAAIVLVQAPRVSRAAKLAACTMYAVGYRVTEVMLPPVPVHGARIIRLPIFFATCLRTSACCSLGFVLRHVIPPFPDFSHPATALNGVLKRFCKTPPTPNSRKMRRLRRFVMRYVKKHYVPIPPDADTSVETWLASTDYPEWRKKQLLSVWTNQPWVEKDDVTNKSFVKKEFYAAYKAARGINSRTDTFKCASGPFFKLMEAQVYHQECFDGLRLTAGDPEPFIKHIPVHLRPEFLRRMFEGNSGPFYETDYSEFEKHFTPEVMNSLELVLYDHMLLHYPQVAAMIRIALAGTNKCVYRGFIIKIAGKRMSGDMCTSLGNGFSNLMLFKFAAYLKGGIAFGVVEGDDALFTSSVLLTHEDFKSLGFDIKIDVYESLHSSSFCGMLSSQDGILLRNIVRVIPKFGWTFSPRRLGGPMVKMALLRARALSLCYESPRCPIIHALAKRALELTYGFEPIFDSGYHHTSVSQWVTLFGEEMMAELEKGPSLQSRVDFAEKFHISVPCQLHAEKIISEWDGTPLSSPFLEALFLDNTDMYDFSMRFVASTEQLATSLADCHSN